MKVIRKGKPPEENIWTGHCRSCGSVIEAKQAELKNIQSDQREGTQFSWECCIVCGAGAKGTGYGGVLFYPKANTSLGKMVSDYYDK